MLPVFRDAARIYTADACTPLRVAAEAREIQIAAVARGHYPGRRLACDALTGVSSVGYWDARREQQWGLPWHRNEGIEISYLERGVVDFEVPSREFQLRAGDIAITRPWELHRVGGSHMKPNKLHWLILDVGVRSCEQSWKWPSWLVLNENEANKLYGNLGRSDRPVWNANAEMRRCFQLIAETVLKDESGRSTSRLAIRINDLLLSLLDLRPVPAASAQVSSNSHAAVQLLLEQLATSHERLAAQWTLESMAAECGLKPTRFVTHVKELTNVAPIQYLNSCRLEHARCLLKSSPSKSVIEIAFDCGFSSSQYFATLFKQRFGLAPTEFRASVSGQL